MSADIPAALRTAVSHSPVLIFLAGPNGAGKSTFFEAYLRALGFPFVNADIIATNLRDRAPGALESDRLAFQTAEELREAHLVAGISFCTETVFSDPHGAKLEFLKRARSASYSVFLIFIGLDNPELSLARVQQRVEAGGHDVPDEKIRARFDRTLANLRAAIPVVNEAFLIDNSSVDHPFRPIAVYSEGRLIEQYPPLPGWARGLPGLPSP